MPSEGHFGASWGQLRPSWALVGAILEPTRGDLEVVKDFSSGSRGQLGALAVAILYCSLRGFLHASKKCEKNVQKQYKKLPEFFDLFFAKIC